MTNSSDRTHWNDDRLDKLASTVEANSRDIAANTASIERLTRLRTEFNRYSPGS